MNEWRHTLPRKHVNIQICFATSLSLHRRAFRTVNVPITHVVPGVAVDLLQWPRCEPITILTHFGSADTYYGEGFDEGRPEEQPAFDQAFPTPP